MAQKSRNLTGAELERMTLGLEQNESPDPLHIGLLGADAIVPYSYQLTHLVQQPNKRIEFAPFGRRLTNGDAPLLTAYAGVI